MAHATNNFSPTDQAVMAAVANGLEICRVAPSEFHVCTGNKADEWADWVEITAAVAWSTTRVGYVISQMPGRTRTDEGFCQYCAGTYLRSEMSLEVRHRLIRQAAAKANVSLEHRSNGDGYECQVAIHPDRIVFRHRHPLGD